MNIKSIILITLVILVIAIGLVFVKDDLLQHRQTQPQEPQSKTLNFLNPPKSLTDFQLTDHHNQSFTLANLKNKWSFIFFGYTHCPDICPSTFSLMQSFYKKLNPYPEIQAKTQILFLSVDPKRDSVKHLASYIPYYNKKFLGLTGKEDAIKKFTTQLGIFYQYPNHREGNYSVDHSNVIILLNPQAQFAGLITSPGTPSIIAKEFINQISSQ